MNKKYVTLIENTKEKEKYLLIANFGKELHRFTTVMVSLVVWFYGFTFGLLFDIPILKPLYASSIIGLILTFPYVLITFVLYLKKHIKARNLFSNLPFLAIFILMFIKYSTNFYIWNKKTSYMDLSLFIKLHYLIPLIFSSSKPLPVILLFSIILIVFSLAIYLFLLIWVIKREKSFSENFGKIKIWIIISIIGLILSQTIFKENFGLLMLINFLGSTVELIAIDMISRILRLHFEHKAYTIEKIEVG